MYDAAQLLHDNPLDVQHCVRIYAVIVTCVGDVVLCYFTLISLDMQIGHPLHTVTQMHPEFLHHATTTIVFATYMLVYQAGDLLLGLAVFLVDTVLAAADYVLSVTEFPPYILQQLPHVLHVQLLPYAHAHLCAYTLRIDT